MSEKNTAADCGKTSPHAEYMTQHLICAVILKFLYHGLRILYRYDDRVRRDLDRIDTGTVIQLSCSSRGPSLKKSFPRKRPSQSAATGIYFQILRFGLRIFSCFCRFYGSDGHRRILFQAYDVCQRRFQQDYVAGSLHGTGGTISVSVIYHTQDFKNTASEKNQFHSSLHVDFPFDASAIV